MVINPSHAFGSTATLAAAHSPAFDLDDLRGGRVVLLVDALDEVPIDLDRQRVIDTLLRFNQDYPKCRVVLTSRNFSWLRRLNGVSHFAEYWIEPLEWRQTTQIIRRIQAGKKIPEEQVQEILRRLQDVHGLKLNPLIVTIVAASAGQSRADVPANITEIFKKYTELMLGRWDARKGLSQQHESTVKDHLLRHIALTMQRQRKTAIAETEIRSIASAYLSEIGKAQRVDELVNEVLFRSNLFSRDGDALVFSHHLLQEFFAGRALRRDDVQALVGDDWWQRAIVFYFGEHPDDVSLLGECLATVDRLENEHLLQACITLGLALQACYLSRIERKTELFLQVVTQLSGVLARHLAVAQPAEPEARPLLNFLSFYTFAREAVSCDVLRINLETVMAAVLPKRDEASERQLFWIAAGLVECGCLADALTVIRESKFNDQFLHFALFLGALLVEKLRSTTKDERRGAHDIVAYLDPKIRHLREQLLKEVKTELLEWRKGAMRSLPEPVGDTEGVSETGNRGNAP